jgi:hyperosmotically inducible periplasmic protein
MNIKAIIIASVLATAIGIAISSCETQPEKDLVAQTEISEMFPQIKVNVRNGVATINGTCSTSEMADSIQKVIMRVKDIQTVVNCTAVQVQENSLTEKTDHMLLSHSAVIIRSFPGVNASVKNAVIYLTGTIKIGDWLKLKPQLEALHPKQIKNDMAIS